MKDAAAHHNIPGPQFIVFFRLHFATDPAAKQLCELLSNLYAAIEYAFETTSLIPQILTSPNGSGLLCHNAEDAIHLASLVARDLSTAVTVGLDHGYVDDCHPYVKNNEIVVMVSDSINYAARLAFADDETGSILVSCSFANFLLKADTNYTNCISEVRTGRVKQTPISYHVLNQLAVLHRFGIMPDRNIPLPTRQGVSDKNGNALVLLLT